MTEEEKCLRRLIYAYINHVGSIEGIDFLSEASDELTEEQRLELVAMRDEGL